MAERLDQLLLARGLVQSRTQARALVMAGRVSSAGRRLDKPGTRYPEDIPLEVAPGARYVGRGGHKLGPVLPYFGIQSRPGDAAIDVGASTGGFTQVLLEAGFLPVIALDVGRGQLDWTLRQDERVHVIEGVNARYLEPTMLPLRPALASIDVSFISLELVLPAVANVLAPDGGIVALVKPQFEVGRRDVGRGGIVRDPELHRAVLEKITHFAEERDWGISGLCASPLRGGDGNREFFAYFEPQGSRVPAKTLAAWMTEALSSSDKESA